MSYCERLCLGSSRFVSGPQTQDGKQTWNVLCEAGKQGGCSGPDFDQLIEFNNAAGNMIGARKRHFIFSPRPLALSASFRLPTSE